MVMLSDAIISADGGELTEIPPRRVERLADAPVFVVGAPRSGTTWVQRILLAHPQVCGGQESHFFAAFGYPLEMFDPPPAGERQVNLSTYWTKPDFFAEIREVWRKTMLPVIAGKPTATILIEKTPQHATMMRRILDLLPDAKFIHVIRDSRAVVASLLAASKEAWGKRWAPADVLGACRMWGVHVREARKVGLTLPAGKYLEMKYEEMRSEPIGPTIKFFKFVGLDVDEEWARKAVAGQSFEKQKESGGTPIPVGVGGDEACTKAGIEPAGFFRQGTADAWRKELTMWQKRLVWKITGKVMTECGYTK